jgi:hypothetical protein
MDDYVNINDLNTRGTFRVVQIFEDHIHPRIKENTLYLKHVLIEYKGMLLTERYVDLVYIQKYLKLFSAKHLVTDEPNPFFKLDSQHNGKDLRIQCKFDEECFIYRAEAETIIDVINSAMRDYSKKYFERGTNCIEALAYVDILNSEETMKLRIMIKEWVDNFKKEIKKTINNPSESEEEK